MKKILCLCFAAAVFISWVGIGSSQQPKGTVPQKSKVHPEVWRKVQENGVVNVIVRLDMPWQSEDKLSKTEIAAQRKAIAETQKRLLGELAGTKHKNASLFPLSPLISLDEVDPYALTILENSTLVLRVTENVVGQTTVSRSVPFVGVGQSTTGNFDGIGFALGILDTGVDKNHPFLQNKVVAEWCFSTRGNCPLKGGQIEGGENSALPCNYAANCIHGTHVAGIAAGVGPDFSGVAKGAKVIAVQVFSRFTGSECPPGESTCAQWILGDLIKALDQMIVAKDSLAIAAINMSLGIRGIRYPDQAACDAFSPDLKEKIDILRSAGIATVIAAGNDGFTDGLSFPACISSAVSVGATAIP